MIKYTDYLALTFHLYDEKDARQFIKTDEEIKLIEAKDLAEKYYLFFILIIFFFGFY
jgi:uncharacterized membrane protein